MAETTSETDYKIRIELDLDSVAWPAVLKVLCDKFGLNYQEGNQLIVSFMRRFRTALNLSWLWRNELLPQEGKLLAAVCEVHGADAVTMIDSRRLVCGWARIQLKQQIDFFPAFRHKEQTKNGGYLSARFVAEVLRKKITIEKLWQALLAHLALISLALLSYVILIGCLLYGLSVFLLFLVEPAFVTLAATNSAVLGLALISVLIGIAGIFGRALQNLFRLGKQSLMRIRTGD